MTKEEAIKKCLSFLDTVDDGKKDSEVMGELIDFLVDEVGMLPPFMYLPVFNRYDNGWEDQ